MRSAPWTDEGTDLLRKLWFHGETASKIAVHLGISRSAVLGKIFRLRLSPAGGSGETAPAPSDGKNQTVMRRRGSFRQKPTSNVKASAKPLTLFELTNTCCRWPYRRPGTEKYFFCGAAGADLEAGIPYCPRHMKRAYLVPPRIVAQSRRPIFRTAGRSART